MEFGIGLWGMQSTRNAPLSHPTLYRRLAEDAQFAEHVGFESLWLTEHRFWYDGYLPSLLTAGGYIAGATTRLRIGTGCLLLPQHDPMRVAQGVNTLDQISHGRLDFGVALGYRDIEYDALGISRKKRASRMENALDILAASSRGASFGECKAYSPERGEAAQLITPSPVQQPVPIWVAAVGEKAVERAARRGLNLLLSDAHDDRRAGELIELYHRTAQSAGVDSSNIRFGILRYVWVDESAARAEAVTIPRLRAFLLEQLGGWRYLSDENGNSLGFDQPVALRKAAEGVIRNNAAIGTPDTVIRRLKNLESVGVNFIVARTHMVSESPEDRHRAMELLASEVAPALSTVGRA
ncbi:MAG: LLM class flavin-dependent oxidoreductase [Candidatus Nanopelagicales bacterium]|nr:LLM class flavin-dependent oxidoreductase [Candidatus Nanopelagicales bacterium]